MPAGSLTAVQQDHHERDHRNSLDREDRQRVAQPGPEMRSQSGSEQEAPASDRHHVAQFRREDRDEQARRNEKDDRLEVGELVHADQAPGSPIDHATRTSPPVCSPT
jgi:hypothetical protein